MQLIEYIKIKNNCSLLDAVREALKQVVGGLCYSCGGKGSSQPYNRRSKSSPLVIGIGRMRCSTPGCHPVCGVHFKGVCIP